MNAAQFDYCINLNERGDFYADVRNPAGETVYEIGGENGTAVAEMITDGFMRNCHDVAGLQDYLQSVGVMPAGAILAHC